MSSADATLKLLGGSLADRIRRSDARRLRHFARGCAWFALRKTNLADDTLESALRAEDGADSASLVESVRRIVKNLDAEGFKLREAHERGAASLEDYLRAFSRARAAESVLAQLEEADPVAAASRAAYEARAATDDPRSLAVIARSLQPTLNRVQGPIDVDVWGSTCRIARAEAQACS